MSPRPLRTLASATSILALVAAGFAATTGAAHADPNVIETPVDLDLCVGTPVWTDPLAPGQHVTGKTTTHGITPEGFEGTYVSTLKNGAGRGKDILLFRMEGSRITKTTAAGDVVTDAGIWAGMSGSPVYDDDGNLVGSVSYGFSGAPSNLAGVTPAKDLLSVQFGTGSTTPPAPAAVPASISRLAAASTLTSKDSAADHGDIQPLALPRVSVGSVNTKKGNTATRFAAKSRALNKQLGGSTPKFTTGSQYDGDIDPEDAIVAGGNIATSWSHGDIALAAVGTITAVCGDKVFAYGHPDDFVGDKSTQTFHAAEAAAIQEDSTFGSFKLANIDMAPVGGITQDRLSGLMGVTGQFPFETTVTTNTTLGADATTAETKVSNPAALSTAIASQIFNDVLSGLDAYSNGGEALMTWTVGYTPQGGAPATYTRTQRISTADFLAEQVGFDVASDVEFLQFGSDTNVRIDSVNIDTQLMPDYKELRISRVDVRSGGKWVKKTSGQSVAVKRGSKLALQVHLTPTKNSSATPVIKQIRVNLPRSAMATQVQMSGGLTSFDDEEYYTIEGDDEEYYDEDDYFSDEPLTLPEVLKALKSQTRNDSLQRTLAYVSGENLRVFQAATSTSAVTSGSHVLRINLRR